MLFLLGIFITAVITIAGYVVSERFVENRLRFVDAVQRPYAPLVAGAAAAGAAMLIVGFIPLIGTGTALLFGLGVSAGVATGARQIRRRLQA